MTVAKEEAWGFCGRKECLTNRGMVWTDEEYPHENFLSQNRRQIVGKCSVCGNNLWRFAANAIGDANPRTQTDQQMAQQELEDDISNTWKKYGKQGRGCPRCGGYMSGAKGSGQEIDNDCLNCGYAGPVMLVTGEIHIRNAERFQSPKMRGY